MGKDEAFPSKDYFFFGDARWTIKEFPTLFAEDVSIYVPPSGQILMQVIAVAIQNQPCIFPCTQSPFSHTKFFLIYPSMDESDCL